MNGLGSVVAAYTMAWTILMIFVATLASRQRRLRRALDRLQAEQVAATWGGPERQRASVAGERSTATARPAGGRRKQKVAEPPPGPGGVRVTDGR
jgi:CcmD family protein